MVGFDAVAFFTPKTTAAGMVGAAGQALRHGRRPVITLIVPVLLARAGTLDQAQEDTAVFDTAWTLVRALRAHDERLAAWLDACRAGHAPGRPAGETPDWLHVLGTPEAVRAVCARMVRVTTSAWEMHVAALEEFHARTGHADVPAATRPEGSTCGNGCIQRPRRAGVSARLRPLIAVRAVR